jgi:hypothetical protein
MVFLAGLTALALLAGACGTAESVESVEPSSSQGAKLPVRDGPRPFTTSGVPHIQVDVEPVPEVDETLRARAFALPGVENRPTVVSLPGGRGLWLDEDVPLARPDMILAGREFSHFHTDGSLHAPLPVDRALEAVEAGWGVLHPWVDRDEIPDGLVMLYTPQSNEEAEVILQLVIDSYNFITGREIDPVELG